MFVYIGKNEKFIQNFNWYIFKEENQVESMPHSVFFLKICLILINRSDMSKVQQYFWIQCIQVKFLSPCHQFNPNQSAHVQLYTRRGNLIFLFSFLSAENVSREDLISTYKVSCKKHGTFPLPHVLNQLQVGTYPRYCSF